MLTQTSSSIDLPSLARPQLSPSLVERLQAWLAARVRARLAPRQRALLPSASVKATAFGGVLALDAERGNATRRLARLRATADASIAVVVSVGALADAADASVLLAEIQRVLRPGGRLLFVEPVAALAGTRLRRLQSSLKRAWRVVAGSRNAPRDLWNDLKAAHFAWLEYAPRKLRGLLGLPVPHLVGEAVRIAAPPISDAPRDRPAGPPSGLPALATLSWGGATFAFFG